MASIARRMPSRKPQAKASQRAMPFASSSASTYFSKVSRCVSVRVGSSFSLLRLPQDVLSSLRQNGLSERHGRALLRLRDAEEQRAALLYIIDNGLTVAATDAYIEALLQEPEPEPAKQEARRTFVLKDVRVFLNTLSRSLDLMKQGGIDAGMRREETESSLILTISIPKAKPGE